jgi:Flp pilus assembly protein TadD
MRIGVARVLVLSGFLSAWLAGCETVQDRTAASGDAELTTGSVTATPPAAELSSVVQDEDPQDNLALGKAYYRQKRFGLAKRHFRRAVEKGPKNVDAWIGLAASCDKLRRFDLADHAYAQAIKHGGPTPEILNNQGYSYLLRGDRARARQTLLAAQAKDPGNPYIRNNLDLLEASLAQRADLQ